MKKTRKEKLSKKQKGKRKRLGHYHDFLLFSSNAVMVLDSQLVQLQREKTETDSKKQRKQRKPQDEIFIREKKRNGENLRDGF